jgi:hypothetical protein
MLFGDVINLENYYRLFNKIIFIFGEKGEYASS